MQVREVTIYQVEMTSAELDTIAEIVYTHRNEYSGGYATVGEDFTTAVGNIRARSNAQPVSKPVPAKH